MTRRERRAIECGHAKTPSKPPTASAAIPPGNRPAIISHPNGPPAVVFPGETVLPDDYPVFWDYLYVGDGRVIRSDIKGTVADLKRDTGCVEIRRCAIVARQKAVREVYRS